MKQLLNRLMGGVATCLLLSTLLSAQESPSYKRLADGRYVVSGASQPMKPTNEGLSGIGLAVGVSVPYGTFAQLGFRIIPQLAVRGGIGFFPKKQLYSKADFDFGNPTEMQEYTKALGYTPGIDAKVAYSNLSGQLLLDWHPFGRGFRLTGGLTFGSPQVHVHAMLIDTKTGRSIMEQESNLDPNNMPRITIQDANDPSAGVTLQPSGDASADVSILWQRNVKPYVGIGYGQIAPKSGVSFFFDLGVLFTGKVGLASPNAIAGDLNTLLDYDPKVQDIVYKAQFLPVLNFGIAIRLASF